ncbi:MAG TPA: ORF6N domain-containing protein [Bacteroidia bacterium]|nr:ORF6N domain-containing protein [Bacteroidia bacterium]
MNKKIDILIHHKIHELCGIKIILDFDLAKLYDVPTKVLKQSLRRNRTRFPEDFLFELTETE